MYCDTTRALVRSTRRTIVLRSAIAGILATTAPAALAQDGSVPAGPEEIVVTGSRIERSGFETPSPLTVLGEQELQNSGVTNVADQLVKIPSFQGSQTPNSVGTGSTRDPAASYLNLRGMGANRTLVLVDGKRHVASSSSGVVDTNLIPFALVERTEVVTGGASAAYGSDAVAGVVNFIINPRFQGFKANVQGGVTEVGDDEKVSVSLAAGQSFADGRLNVAFAGQYYDSGETYPVGRRDWGRGDWKLLTNPAYTPTNGQYRLITSPNAGFSVASNGGMINAGPLRGTQFGPGGSVEPFEYGASAGSTFMIGGDYDTLDRATRPGVIDLRRANGYGRVGYEITDNVTATFEVTVADSSARSQVTGSTDVGAGGAITIQRDNAFLPEEVRQSMIAANIASFRMGRLNPELGFIEPVTDSSLQRYVLSFDGEFGNNWRWSAYGQLGKTRYKQVYTGNRNQERWRLAVDAVRAPDGGIVCRSTLTDPTNGCIPANVFGDGALHTTDVASYVLMDPQSTTRSEEQAVGVTLGGDPFEIWAGPISIAVGAEWRKEELRTVADELSNAQVFRVGNIRSMSGEFSVKEAFAEVVVPLAKGQKFAQALDLNLAGRTTDYSISGSVETWKIGLSYQPADAVRLRAAMSRDIRAANINELFASGTLNSGGTVVDPATGIQYAPRTRSGGNRDLLPEEADSFTYGVVWTPLGALSGLRASIDRYSIKLENAIGTFSPQTMVNYCFNGNTSLCNLIDRDANNAITFVNQTFVNFGYVKTSGVDVELAYNLPLAASDGNLDFRLLGNYVDEFTESDGGENTLDLSGSVDRPDWKLSARVTYASGAYRAYLENQYIPSLMLDASYTSQDIARNRVGSQNVVNASFAYNIAYLDLPKFEVFANVDNLFDKDPPIVAGGGVNYLQTNASLYDVLGRRYMAGVRIQF